MEMIKMSEKNYARCHECLEIFAEAELVHIKGLGYFCKKCYAHDRDILNIVNNIEKFEK